MKKAIGRFTPALMALGVIGLFAGSALLLIQPAQAEITVANGPASPSPGTGIVVTNTAATTALDNSNGFTPFTSVTIFASRDSLMAQ